MGEQTAIAWTDATFNPWLGCAKVSAGCAHCYAEAFTRNRMGLDLWGTERRRTSVANWRNPVKWNRAAEAQGARRRVFCASLCDVFENHPVAEAARPDLWGLIRACPSLDWQLLTKRPERIAECLPPDWGDGWPNVWLGTTIEDARVAERADALRAVPAAIRFISYEPAIGPLAGSIDLTGIGWLIYGGESGSGRRPDSTEWADGMREECERRGVAFFYKQASAARPGFVPDGYSPVREFPTPKRAAAIGRGETTTTEKETE